MRLGQDAQPLAVAAPEQQILCADPGAELLEPMRLLADGSLVPGVLPAAGAPGPSRALWIGGGVIAIALLALVLGRGRAASF